MSPCHLGALAPESYSSPSSQQYQSPPLLCFQARWPFPSLPAYRHTAPVGPTEPIVCSHSLPPRCPVSPQPPHLETQVPITRGHAITPWWLLSHSGTRPLSFLTLPTGVAWPHKWDLSSLPSFLSSCLVVLALSLSLALLPPPTSSLVSRRGSSPISFLPYLPCSQRSTPHSPSPPQAFNHCFHVNSSQVSTTRSDFSVEGSQPLRSQFRAGENSAITR